jgi:hypothetical protein
MFINYTTLYLLKEAIIFNFIELNCNTADRAHSNVRYGNQHLAGWKRYPHLFLASMQMRDYPSLERNPAGSKKSGNIGEEEGIFGNQIYGRAVKMTGTGS